MRMYLANREKDNGGALEMDSYEVTKSGTTQDKENVPELNPHLISGANKDRVLSQPNQQKSLVRRQVDPSA